MKAFIAVPTYNGGDIWKIAAENIKKYIPKDVLVQVIDSSSNDSTVLISELNGFSVLKISTMDFNHGGTRNTAVTMHKNDYDVVIFLTQDSIPQEGFYDALLKSFDDPSVACAYGRQLPHDDANGLAQHARLFNYKKEGYVSSLSSRDAMGIKTVFLSNSFAAYRVSIFNELGGFPDNTILSEDMFFAAKAIMAGYKVVYNSEAKVKHSHNYSALDEFKRYFDIGVFHAQEPWIREKFGGAGSEGAKFIKSEFLYLLETNKKNIFKACVNNFFKIMGYKLGQHYQKIPERILPILSMHKKYWKQ